MPISVAVDGYLREQDLFALKGEDVITFKGETILRLGSSSRGESTKTGRDQGVRLDSPHSSEIVRRLAAKAGPKRKGAPDYITRL